MSTESMIERAAKAVRDAWPDGYVVARRAAIDPRSGAHHLNPVLGGPSFTKMARAAIGAALDPECADVMEGLAAVEHERWSSWQQYLHSKCITNADGSLTIPSDLAAHWHRQYMTRYADLSDAEKESDRKEVRVTLAFLRASAASVEDGTPQTHVDGDTHA